MDPRRQGRRMRVLGLAPLVLAAGVALAEPAPLRLASDVWPPFTDQPGSVRVALDLVREAFDRSGIRGATAIRDDFAEVLAALEAGEIDGSAALWRSPEREASLVFSQPYLENRLVLLGRKGSPVTQASVGALAGSRVAIVDEYAYGGALRVSPGPEWVTGASDQENVERLLRGEVDYVLADELVVHELFQRQGPKARALLERGRRALVRRGLHLALRRDRPDAAETVARFDAALREMVLDGSYNRILGITWIRADIDGDGRSELVLGGQKAGSEAPQESYEIVQREGDPEAEGEGGGEEQAEAGVDAVDPEERARYVIEGEVYQGWTNVPPRYRVPVEPQGEELGEGDRPQPSVVLFEF